MCYVKNLTRFLVECTRFDDRHLIVNYADGPDLSVKELVELVRRELNMTPRFDIGLPYPLGLTAGYLADCIGLVTGRSYAISSQRIRKFCADTRIATCVLDELEFRRPFSLDEGLRRMIGSMPFESEVTTATARASRGG
jgi:nucleoside-diphosphate-sugar epimerase